MERICVAGVSYRDGDVGLLERFTVPREERAARLPELARQLGTGELVYLATCNRVEVAFRGDGRTPLGAYRPRLFRALTGREPAAGEAERTFRAWAGEGAVEHLFLVAAGLDSAQPGEHEVRAQLRDALQLARAAGLGGTLLDLVITEALRAASRVHRQLEPEAGSHGSGVSLADVAAEHLLDRVSRTPGAVALVGISPMTRRCAHLLNRQGVPLWIVNRTLERAWELVTVLDRQSGTAETCSLAEFQRRPPAVEAVLLATGAAEAILGRRELERLAAHTPSGEAPLLVDLGVPANADPEGARQAGVPRLSMAEITAQADAGRRRRLVELAPARELVDEALAQLRRRLAERLLAPVAAGVGRRYRETVAAGLERLLRKELAHLGPEEREALGRWGEVLARRLAHIPTVGLRALAAEGGAPAVRTFLQAAAPDLLPALAMDLTVDLTEDPDRRPGLEPIAEPQEKQEKGAP